MKRLFLISSLSFVSGCIPVPYTHYHAPGVSGFVVSDSRPVSGAVVTLSAMNTDKVREAKTSADGEFYIEPISERKFPISLMGHSYYGYSVEISHEKERYVCMQDTGPGEAERQFSNLICEKGRNNLACVGGRCWPETKPLN